MVSAARRNAAEAFAADTWARRLAATPRKPLPDREPARLWAAVREEVVASTPLQPLVPDVYAQNGLFDQLDDLVNRTNERILAIKLREQEAAGFQYIHFTRERLKPMLVAKEMRFHGIAAHPPQVAFYQQLARRAGIRTVCEIGFNAGHSAAVWLTASPTLHVYSFDLMDTSMGLAAVDYLQRRFAGRLTAFGGDSLVEVKKARLPPCDLIHVDGKHDYEHVIQDTLNMRRHAAPAAIFLFDDVCDTKDCSLTKNIYAGGPALAVCDLVGSGLLRGPIEAKFDDKSRQWATYEAGSSALPPRGLPAGERCNMTWRSSSSQRAWAEGGMARKIQSQQLHVGRMSLRRSGP